MFLEMCSSIMVPASELCPTRVLKMEHQNVFLKFSIKGKKHMIKVQSQHDQRQKVQNHMELRKYRV
jgi:hypothetical protein